MKFFWVILSQNIIMQAFQKVSFEMVMVYVNFVINNLAWICLLFIASFCFLYTIILGQESSIPCFPSRKVDILSLFCREKCLISKTINFFNN